MDVVTGGASAAYGSGAISGVNNIILNKTLEGAKVDADYGITGHGDGDNYHVAAAAGTKLFDGRGHLVIAGEYQSQDEVGCANSSAHGARKISGYLNNANTTHRDARHEHGDGAKPVYAIRPQPAAIQSCEDISLERD